MNKTKKLLSLLISVAMVVTVFTSFGVNVSAASSEINTYTDLFNAHTSGEVLTVTTDNISGTDGVVFQNTTLTLDLNGKTLAVGCIILLNATLTVKNGTLKSGDYPTAGLITANNSVINMENAISFVEKVITRSLVTMLSRLIVDRLQMYLTVILKEEIAKGGPEAT